MHAFGYDQCKPVGDDSVVLNGLEQATVVESWYNDSNIVPAAAATYTAVQNRPAHQAVQYDLKGADGYNYLYRINCGGDDYTDTFGQNWLQDNTTFSRSWADEFIANGDTLLSPYQASQRRTYDPIIGTRDWELFQTFRFGRHKLYYEFPLPNGEYRVELYFTEPWHGTGGSAKTDCEGLRLFDVAVNNKTVIRNMDIWAETGHDGALKKVVDATVDNGVLKISFPEVKAGQAVISGIAIARKGGSMPAMLNQHLPVKVTPDFTWAAQEKKGMEKTPKEMLPEDKNARAQVAYQAEDATLKGNYTKKEHRKQIGVFFGKGTKNSITWDISTGLAQVYALRFKYMNTSGKPLRLRVRLIDSKDGVLKDDELTFGDAPEKWRMLSTTTGGFINAGYYKVEISGEDMNGIAFDALDVQ